MKVLFLSHIPIYPVIGGDRVRISQALRFLLDAHEVDVAYISHSRSNPSLKEHEPRIGKEIRFEVPFPLRVVQAAKTLFNRFPSVVNHFHNAGMQKFVNRHGSDYDLLVCSGVPTAVYAFESRTEKKILDMTDSLTMNYLNAASNSSGIRKLLFKFDAKRMRMFEIECAGVFNKISYISEKDRHFVGIPDHKTACVPNFVPKRKMCHVGSNSNLRNIVFVGKMDYEPNITAVRFFVKEVLPKLPDCVRFHIVGMNPANEVENLAEDSRVSVTGYVDSVSEYYDMADMVVAPMLSGSGVQNKILEAMAHGACVVTTPIGAEGLERVGEGFVVTQADGDVMADCIRHLLENPEESAEIAQKGKSLVEEYFGYAGIRDIFHHTMMLPVADNVV